LFKYLLVAALLALYVTHLGGVGFLGPDEPRYASIGRAMARTGDWVTPRLDGAPWFEKPPLLYWMTAVGHRLHLSDEWAARFPVALLSLVFLMFFYGTLAREFSERVALAATTILATSAGWTAYSFGAVTDLPMSAALGASMLIALFGSSAFPNRAREQVWQGFVSGALLGLAVLAKGFPPLLLMGPAFLVARQKRLAMIAGCAVVAAPWYVLCAARNPGVFWHEFFWRHQVERYLHPTFEHVQPFWFYIPVLLAGLFPWTPLAALLFRPKTYDDPRVRFLVFWLAIGLAFFSYPQTKLPGYVLPLLPALAVVLAVALDKAPGTAWWLASCVLGLAAVPVIAHVLPDALRTRITSVHFSFALGWPFVLAAGVVFWLAWRGMREWAVFAAALAAIGALAYVKLVTFPALDQRDSVRAFWRANGAQAEGACVNNLPPDWTYQLNYYADRPLPQCGTQSRRIVVIGEKLQVMQVQE
jgi:4-amino-4-deoxy-L-arabinose transferase-like glycosyltransferase